MAAKGSVEDVLAHGLRHLAFPDSLEQQFEADTLPARRRLLLTCALIGWIGLWIGSRDNHRLMPDLVERNDLVVALLLSIMAASMIGLLLIPKALQKTTMYEAVTAMNTGLVGGAMIWAGVDSMAISATTQSASLVGVILYASIAARQRFRWALGTSVLCLMGYLLFMKGHTPLHQLVVDSNIRLLFITTPLALFANYSFEYQERKAWLLRRLDKSRLRALQRTKEQLHELSIRDALTGLYNRRQFEADLAQAWSQAHIDNTPVAMLLIDVDYFKRYNDTYGHPAGDACLIMVAKAMQELAEAEQGSAGRLGGEEFGLLLPGRSKEQAFELGERLCETIRQAGMPHRNSDIAHCVTISVGTATVMPASGVNQSELFQMVDEALYNAKHLGRNRACAAIFEPSLAQVESNLGAPKITPISEPTPPSDSAQLDHILKSGFKCLRFPKDVEQRYMDDRAESRRKHLAISALVGLMLISLDTVMSREMFPDVQDSVINAQLIFGVLLFLMVGVAFMPLKTWVSESIYAGAVSAIGLSSVWVLSQSRSLTVFTHFVILFVIPFFAGVVGRQPFWYSLVPSLITVVACGTMLHPVDELQQLIFANSMFIVTNATLYTLIAAYTLEHGERKSWLMTQIEQRRHHTLHQATQQLNTLSKLDPLTGIANRRQFEADFEKTWERCRQDFKPMAMLIMDVDYFKAYNDHYGHPAGDRCLQHVSKIIESTAQARGGVAARLGGEEFGILLPQTDLVSAVETGEALCQAIRQARLSHAYSSIAPHLTISIGAACIPPGTQAHTTRQLLAAADHGLYQAKSTGRDRVCACVSSS